jgi:hypothetical protein
MKSLLAALLAITHLVVLPAAAGARPGGSEIAFTNVTLVPMDSERLVPGQTVVVRDGRITAIGQTAAMTLPADLPQIDGSGRFLMPGLAEMHAHVPPSPQRRNGPRTFCSSTSPTGSPSPARCSERRTTRAEGQSGARRDRLSAASAIRPVVQRQQRRFAGRRPQDGRRAEGGRLRFPQNPSGARPAAL